MTFKIVATRTRRGTEITLCPSAWENEGLLSWPPKNVSRLQSDQTSEPEGHWQQYKCLVKKKDITTYKEALRWESAIQNADTEEEAELTLPITVTQQQVKNTLKVPEKNSYDALMEGILVGDDVTNLPNLGAVGSPFKDMLLDMPVVQIDEVDIGSKIDNLQEKIGTLQEEVADLKQEFSAYRIQQNVNNAKLLVMLDKIASDIQEVYKTRKVEEPTQEKIRNLFTKYTLPINSLDELKNFNNDLNGDSDFFESAEKHYNTFVGTDGTGRGEVLGKQMAEQIMSRSLMTKMSWTGVSRTSGCEKKFAFQSLEAIVNLFNSVLLKADNRWSYQKNEKLFSGALLKHAKKRALAEKTKLEKVTKKVTSTLTAEQASLKQTDIQSSSERLVEPETSSDLSTKQASSKQYENQSSDPAANHVSPESSD